MNAEAFRSMVHRQLVAALNTVGQVIEAAHEGLWLADHIDGKMNQAVFHTLFFADLYLNKSPEGFKDQEFHRNNLTLFQDYQEERDEEPTNIYSRSACAEYLEFCKHKAEAATSIETEESLTGESGFSWYACTRAEMYLINIRHIQHHAAQLGLRLQMAGKSPLQWKSGL